MNRGDSEREKQRYSYSDGDMVECSRTAITGKGNSHSRYRHSHTSPSTRRRSLSCWYAKWLTDTNKDNQLTPWSSVLLKKLIVAQLIKIFPTFHAFRRFITVFMRACHWLPYWARCTQLTVSLRYTLILFFFHQCLGLPNYLSPSDFPKIRFSISTHATNPTHLILDLITLIIFREE
jgi:hypothetical protein